MCNTCGNNGRNTGCGCVNLLNEFADAINNFFTNPCGCGCGNNNQWRNGFTSGWNARGNSRTWRNGFESGWQARGNNGCGCGCGCGNNRNSQCGCGCNGTANLSNFTCCGNYDDYYARQYGLNGNGSCCSL